MIMLSIVLPVYKVEPWIERCLRSIIEDPGFAGSCELIVVDDGSPDGSIEIAERVCLGRMDVRFIRQENQGLGAARNAGAAAIRGDYLWFVDSDDWLADMGVSRVLQAIYSQPKVDILNIDYVMSNGKRSTVANSAINGKIYSGIEYLSISIVQNPVQYYIFSTDYYKRRGLKFLSGIYHEDALFTPVALVDAERVMRVAQDCYVYNIREGSIMKSGNYLKHALDMMRVVEDLESFRLLHEKKCSGASVLADYSALGVGGIYYYWKKLDRQGRAQVADRLRFLTLLIPVLRSKRLKFLFVVAAMWMSSIGRTKASN